MGNNNHKGKPQKELLNELDSIKELLDQAEEDLKPAPWEFTPSSETLEDDGADAIPQLDDVVNLPPPAVNPDNGYGDIPLLEEVAFDYSKRKKITPPDGEELQRIIDIIVEKRLNELKPSVTKQVVAELKRVYPSLKKP